MRLKLISCEVFAREVAALLKETLPHPLSVTLLQKGLHELPSARMSAELQAAIDKASLEEFDAILLGYGLCGYGTVAVKARNVPIVVPRTHDCIAILMGSHRRYADYFDRYPDTYFRSSGWLERRTNPPRLRSSSVAEQHGLNATAADRREKHSEEASAYLDTILGHQRKHYRRLAFIQTGVESTTRFEEQCHAEAAAQGWEFEKVPGDLRLLRKLLHGDWLDNGEFLIVQPGQEIRPTYDEAIVGSVVAQAKETA